MTLKSQMITDLDVFVNFDEFAKTVSYTPVGGVAVDIDAIVIRMAIFQESYVRGVNTAHSDVIVKNIDVSNPQFGDLFEFDSDTWELDPSRGVIYEDENMVRIGLERRLT